jgi:23S rRNA pseudoU1915 N3-methylase RlmH
LLPEGVPFFALLPEPEPAFLTSAFTAASAAGFSAQSVALRTEHDPVQIVWKNEQNQITKSTDTDVLQNTIQEYLAARGEPVNYLYIHVAGLIALAEAGMLKKPEQEFDEALRNTNALFESILKDDERFVHYSTGESVDTGMWGLDTSGKSTRSTRPPAQSETNESLSDRVEVAVVTYLQKNQKAIYLEIENDLNSHFTGLLTPSKGMIYAVLNSYAERESGYWKLRTEDVATARREELNNIYVLIETIGKRLEYKTRKQGKLLHWEENGKVVRTFNVLASALLGRALQDAAPNTVIVIPGGRAALAAYKQERDPSLATQLKKHTLVKYRLLRTLLEVPILTRETFEEQIASDPVEKSTGQMMMF